MVLIFSLILFTLLSGRRRNNPVRSVGRVPSNFGDYGNQVYLVPSNFSIRSSSCPWALWEAYSASQDLRSTFKGEGKKSGKWNGWKMGGAITGDGEGIEEEKEGGRHSSTLRSPPTFQPWWRLWLENLTAVLVSAVWLFNVTGCSRNSRTDHVTIVILVLQRRVRGPWS